MIKTKRNKIDPKNGLSILQSTINLIAKNRKENGTNSMYGPKNAAAKKYLLIAPNGQKIGAWGNLKKICKKYKLNIIRIRNYIDKNIIPMTFYKNNIQAINCTDWQIISI